MRVSTLDKLTKKATSRVIVPEDIVEKVKPKKGGEEKYRRKERIPYAFSRRTE